VRTESAGGVADARAALDRLAPDLIVLDLGLPDGDGGEIVDRLREQGRLGSVAIVVYTARDVEGPEQERLAGAEILTKGRVGPQELERRAMALLGRAAGLSGS
jgi:two-component system, OmpR family, response regulator QseB